MGADAVHITSGILELFKALDSAKFSLPQKCTSPGMAKRSFGGNCSTTLFAQSKYSRRRSIPQSAGGIGCHIGQIAILSAILTSAASRDLEDAFSIRNSLRRDFGNDLSSVTSATTEATASPNRETSSS